MKCSELTPLIEGVSNLIVAGQGRPALLEPLKRLLACSPNKTVADFAKQLHAIAQDTGATENGKLEHAIEVLECTAAIVRNCGKPAVIKDLAVLLPALRLHASTNIERLVSTLQAPPTTKTDREKSHPSEVAAYNRRLEIVLGDDEGFNAEYSRLESDTTLSAADFVSLAKLFTMATVKTRPAALKKIRSRHQNLMVGRAKQAATGGRVAG